MIDIVNLDHIVLYTDAHFDQMLHFYSSILGCRIEREVTEVQLVQLRAGNAIIDLQKRAVDKKSSTQLTPDNHNMAHFCLTIGQPINQALISWLKSLGISSSRINYNYGAQGFGDSIYITDPCGNIVELKQHLSTN